MANENDDKKPVPIRLSGPERRALRMLAGSQDLTMVEWTTSQIQQEWEAKFPGMEYPDENGEIKPKKARTI